MNIFFGTIHNGIFTFFFLGLLKMAASLLTATYTTQLITKSFFSKLYSKKKQKNKYK